MTTQSIEGGSEDPPDAHLGAPSHLAISHSSPLLGIESSATAASMKEDPSPSSSQTAQPRQLYGFNVRVRCQEDKWGGLGLFAEEFIAKGTVIWTECNNVNTLRMSRAQYRTLCNSEHSAQVSPHSFALWDGFSTYSYYEAADDCLVFCADNMRYMNHSQDAPNSEMVGSSSVALRDILPGEELLEDFTSYDAYPWPEPYDSWSEAEGHVADAVRMVYLQAHQDNWKPTLLETMSCFVAPAGGKGNGLFIGRKASQGTCIWNNFPGSTLFIPQHVWETFIKSDLIRSPKSKSLHNAILWYSYYEKRVDSLALCLDNSRYMNHNAERAACMSEYDDGREGNDMGCTVLARDLQEGEELDDDYREYDVCPWAVMAWEEFVPGYRPHCS
mgnify:CR=1 FL=1